MYPRSAGIYTGKAMAYVKIDMRQSGLFVSRCKIGRGAGYHKKGRRAGGGREEGSVRLRGEDEAALGS